MILQKVDDFLKEFAFLRNITEMLVKVIRESIAPNLDDRRKFYSYDQILHIFEHLIPYNLLRIPLHS